MNRIHLNTKDLEIINAIVQEHEISVFELIMTSNSGIGYTLDLEYSTHLHGRDATITVPVTGPENW
jgi:hypothetical protein